MNKIKWRKNRSPRYGDDLEQWVALIDADCYVSIVLTEENEYVLIISIHWQSFFERRMRDVVGRYPTLEKAKKEAECVIVNKSKN